MPSGFDDTCHRRGASLAGCAPESSINLSKTSQQTLTAPGSAPSHCVYEFGPFRLDTASSLLLRDGQAVPLKPKAFDTLLLLVQNGGRTLGKNELMRDLWPNSVVEEANLTQNIYLLRKALGEAPRDHRYIENVARRGYRFVAPVRELRVEGAARGQEIRSIAILPFQPLAADYRDESLELGIADALITTLSNAPQIVVRPISAVRRYADPGQNALKAGRELRVDAVLDGSLQKSGSRLRVTVRLSRVGDGVTLWADKFDESFTDIFAVQDLIAEKIGGALLPHVSGPGRASLARGSTANVEAYQLYLKGRYNWNKASEEGLRKAIDFFNQAIAMDPNYALAYAGLSDCYTSLDWYGVLSTRESNPQAKAAAENAVAIDGTLAEGHAALAMALQYQWDWPAAEREHRKGIELNPNCAAAHQGYGVFLAFMARFEEALAEMRRAQELDPVSLSIGAQTGLVLQCARRYDEAVEQCLKTLDVEPTNLEARFMLAITYASQGSFDDAIAEYQQIAGDNPDIQAMLGHALAASGRDVEARAILEGLTERAKSRYSPPFWTALVHVGLGDLDAALACLEQAYDDPDDSFIVIKVFPLLDPLREDPRFTDLLRRMNLA